MMTWVMLDKRMTPAHLGFIPTFLDDADPRSAKEQINDNYRHGGGWSKFDGFEFNTNSKAIKYPGDPAQRPLAQTKLRDEFIYFYEHSWVLILQPDGSYEIARID